MNMNIWIHVGKHLISNHGMIVMKYTMCWMWYFLIHLNISDIPYSNHLVLIQSILLLILKFHIQMRYWNQCKWTSYETHMNGNEGLIEEELDGVYIDWINEFSICGAIRLMEEKDVYDFMDWITICNVISLIL